MPETPGHLLQRRVHRYRYAAACYRLLPDAGNADGVRPSLYVAQAGRWLPVLPVTVTHTPICSGQYARDSRGGARAF